MNIGYDWYKIFYSVAKNCSITTASRELFISQPAVSQSIKQLEESFDCKLFVRRRSGVFMTAEGRVLHKYIENAVKQIELGETRLKSHLALDKGEIHIGASDMTLQYFLLPYLEEFHRQHPKIKISIINGPTPETLRKLEEDEIDFGVVSEPIVNIINKDNIWIIPVKEIEDVFICGKKIKRDLEIKRANAAMSKWKSVEAEGRDSFEDEKNLKMTLKELAEMPLIMLEPNTSAREHIDTFFSENGITVSPEFELATSSLIVQFARRNLGVGCVVREFAANDLKKRLVHEIILEKTPQKRQICIIRKETTFSKASRLLLRKLRGQT